MLSDTSCVEGSFVSNEIGKADQKEDEHEKVKGHGVKVAETAAGGNGVLIYWRILYFSPPTDKVARLDSL